MKTITTLIIAVLLIPVAGHCIDGSAINKRFAERQQAEQKAKAEKHAIENAEKERQANEKREAYLQSKGKGFALSIEEIDALENNIYSRKPVKIFTDNMNKCSGLTGINAMACDGTITGGLKLYPGSTHSFNTASAHIVDGNTIIEFAFAKLLSYEAKRPDGVYETYTWDKDKGITTYKVTDGTNLMISKINMNDPKKTRIVDVNLPINAQSTLAQIFNKRGVSLSEKAIVGMIEGFYKAELMPKGTTIQQLMTDMITDIDVRDQFLQYCQKAAIPTKKSTVTPSTTEY